MERQVVVKIQASWTDENLNAFAEWLGNELENNNLSTEDNAAVLSVEFADEENQ